LRARTARVGDNSRGGPKPDRHRRARALKDRAGRDGRLPAARGTLQQHAPDRPGFRVPASRTVEALGPSPPQEMGSTGLLGPKLGLEFGLISWVFPHRLEHYMLGHLGHRARKLNPFKMVKVPLGVILKTVPRLKTPPPAVVP
jgi:hypothetical protein